MPVIDRRQVTAYAFCQDGHCPGYAMAEVPAERIEVGYTFEENDGDIPGIERSQVTWEYADEADVACPVCEQPRALSDKPRPQYDPLSGHDPLGLLGGLKYDPTVVNTQADHEIAELKAQVNRLAAIVEAKPTRRTKET